MNTEDTPCETCTEPAEPDLCQHDHDLCPECLHNCHDCMTEIRDQELYDNERDDR